MEETEPRETLPETSPSRSPMPKLQPQLQIHLHRLPDFILQSALSLPLQLPHCLDQCTPQLQPKLSQPVTQPAVSQLSHSTTQSVPKLSQPKAHSASPISPVTDSTQKSLLLRLHRLPQSVVQSALHLHKCISTSSQQHHQSPESEVQRPGVLTETCRGNKDKSQTVDPDTELQEGTQEEQDAKQGDQLEEEDTSVKGTVLQNCPTTDPPYVLHSQNPADCASVNTLTGLTNGFPQKGLLQNKYKIRVDFKVRCCTNVGKHFFILPLTSMNNCLHIAFQQLNYMSNFTFSPTPKKDQSNFSIKKKNTSVDYGWEIPCRSKKEHKYCRCLIWVEDCSASASEVFDETSGWDLKYIGPLTGSKSTHYCKALEVKVFTKWLMKCPLTKLKRNSYCCEI